MTLNASEQLLVELINRARLDPLAEAERLGIDLNQGLAAGTLNGTAKQVVAPNMLLQTAARLHSEWMLDVNIFSHTGINGSSPRMRMSDAGYAFTSSWRTGENIAWSGTTGRLDPIAALTTHHDGLFRSAGHRENMLQASFRELGASQVLGSYTDSRSGITFTSSSMLTEKFAVSGTSVFVTGVAYRDADTNGFYSIGEGVAGLSISVGGARVQTMAAGGYSLALSPRTSAEVSAGALRLSLDLSQGNAKLDVVNGTEVKTSVNTTLLAGVTQATLLGVADLSLTGSAASEVLSGNKGANQIKGGAGHDTILGGGDKTNHLFGEDGNDLIFAGSGGDFIGGGAGNDTIRGGDGADTLYGGWGNDDLAGGGGNDLIFGAAGSNVIWGGLGNDTLHGAIGADTIYGGGNGTNIIFGHGGDDVIHAGAGGDFIGGGAGNDVIRGGAGRDTIYGGLGNDDIAGGAGDDVLFGAAGNNTIWGGLGNDRIHAGLGRDVMSGGPGADEFVFASAEHVGMAASRDVITDFETGIDRINLSAFGGRFNGEDGLLGGAQASFYFSVADGLLIGDRNGDGVADWELALANGATVTASDFIL